MGGVRVGWEKVFCFIVLFLRLYCVVKEQNKRTILILKNNNSKLNSNGAVNM